jgi:hypothetical protein
MGILDFSTVIPNLQQIRFMELRKYAMCVEYIIAGLRIMSVSSLRTRTKNSWTLFEREGTNQPYHFKPGSDRQDAQFEKRKKE